MGIKDIPQLCLQGGITVVAAGLIYLANLSKHGWKTESVNEIGDLRYIYQTRVDWSGKQWDQMFTEPRNGILRRFHRKSYLGPNKVTE